MLNKRDYLLRKALCKIFGSIIHVDIVAMIQSTLDKEDSILDIGCGIKTFVKFIRCKSLTGIDIYKDYLEEGDICGDVTNLNNIVAENSYDVILCLDLIEHLKKEDGQKLINDMIRTCRKKIIILTPSVWSENIDAVKNPEYWSYNNDYNYHQSLWTRKDFFDLGFVEFDHPYKKDYIIVVKEK